MKSKTYIFRKLRHYYGKVIFSESLRSQKGQNKPKKHPKIQLITYIWKKNSQWLCARSIIMMHFLPKTHKLSLELRILERISKMSMKSSLYQKNQMHIALNWKWMAKNEQAPISLPRAARSLFQTKKMKKIVEGLS